MCSVNLQAPRARAKRERVEALAQLMLADHADGLDRLRRVGEEFFAGESAGRTYDRRPNLSVTLAAEGRPRARLRIYPEWRGRCWRELQGLNPHHIVAELVVERVCACCGGCRPSLEA